VKVTGIAIAVLGVVIALFCGIAQMNYKARSENDAVLQTEQRRSPNLTIPLVVAGFAVVGGIAMWAFGDRGTNVDRRVPPPAVEG